MFYRNGDPLAMEESLKLLSMMGYSGLIFKIKKLKALIEEDRVVRIKEKLENFRKKMQDRIKLDGLMESLFGDDSEASCDVPSLEEERALVVMNGFPPDSEDIGLGKVHEVISTKSITLPRVERIPRYKTWVLTKRNQLMAEDQSVIGRKRIYYDQSRGEALICSDSEEDVPAETEAEKIEFSEGEDRILCMAFKELGLDDDVAEVVSHFVRGTPMEIKERFKEVKLKYNKALKEEGSSESQDKFLDQSLNAALDTFDNLFCRRCYVFDCRVHGCGQPIVQTSGKPLKSSDEPLDSMIRKPCSDKCYLLVTPTSHDMNLEVILSSTDISTDCSLKAASGKGSTSGVSSALEALPEAGSAANVAKRKTSDNNVRESHESGSSRKSTDKRKAKTTNVVRLNIGNNNDRELEGSGSSEKATDKRPEKSTNDNESRELEGSSSFRKSIEERQMKNQADNSKSVVSASAVSSDKVTKSSVESSEGLITYERRRSPSSCEWKLMEKELFLKGLEIFGNNSCLITSNLLTGCKTCIEVYDYMENNRDLVTQVIADVNLSENDAGANSSDDEEPETMVTPKPRSARRKGRARRLKFSAKSGTRPSSLKKADAADMPCKQYTPCSCQGVCGRDCSCVVTGTCCEKYCGCSKGCKNKFRGCHCGKDQCRTQLCPCFAANRECDPDVCRNCWVSCGGGDLGEPPKQGLGPCGNMKIFLGQQQRILLGLSDVTGWGAFTKNSVEPNEYLGEYTGELLSHYEADKRGKVYDRANSSFLFDLNDKFVLDAGRQGNKLKFANHSSDPNCCCKVMLVGGDHRVGIFAKERIEAGEELFYDYHYGLEQAPVWAQSPTDAKDKKDEAGPSQTRARKHQSR